MYSLSLSIEEQQALMELLECSISEIHTEIIHTDHREFREMLKTRKQMLVKMLDTMRSQQLSTQGI